MSGTLAQLMAHPLLPPQYANCFSIEHWKVEADGVTIYLRPTKAVVLDQIRLHIGAFREVDAQHQEPGGLGMNIAKPWLIRSEDVLVIKLSVPDSEPPRITTA